MSRFSRSMIKEGLIMSLGVLLIGVVLIITSTMFKISLFVVGLLAFVVFMGA